MGKKYLSPNQLVENHKKFMEVLNHEKAQSKEIITAFKRKEISFKEAHHYLATCMQTVEDTYNRLFPIGE